MSAFDQDNLRYTVPLGDHFIHFVASQEALRADVVSAGSQLGMDQQKLREGAEKVRFAFSNNAEQRRYEASRSRNPMKRAYESAMAHVPPISDAYVTLPDRDGAFECWFFPGDITRGTNKRFAHYPIEVRAAAAHQKLIQIWQHERRHVLQRLDPVRLARAKREMAISSAVVGLGMVANAAAIVSRVIPNVPYELVRDTTLAAAAGEFAIVGAVAAHAWFVSDERESQTAGDVAVPRWQSPIQMIVES